MQSKIALEEHFAIDETVETSKQFMPDDRWTELRARLLDLHGQRLSLMDHYGIEKMIVSLNAPGIQAILTRPAPSTSRAEPTIVWRSRLLAGRIVSRDSLHCPSRILTRPSPSFSGPSAIWDSRVH